MGLTKGDTMLIQIKFTCPHCTKIIEGYGKVDEMGTETYITVTCPHCKQMSQTDSKDTYLQGQVWRNDIRASC